MGRYTVHGMSAGDDGRIVAPPSMAQLATERIRSLILGGELAPGQRLVESMLTERLGVSRPPVREALKDLQHEGLVAALPRGGVAVRELTHHDVFEIVTLRDELERLAVRLGVPVRDPARLEALRARLADLESAEQVPDAEGGTDLALVRRGFEFHVALVALAGHDRLVETYRSLQWQMQLCMRLNVAARGPAEGAAGNAHRHRVLLDAVESGDADAVLAALAAHGHDSFVWTLVDDLPGRTTDSTAWHAQVR